MKVKTPYILILAGGSGTRFWPLSRKKNPKQVLQIFGEETLLQQTIHRISDWVEMEKIFLLTNEEQKTIIQKNAPQIPENQIIVEPEKRDTAPALALALGEIARRDKEASIAVLPADHLIEKKDDFLATLQESTRWTKEAIVTIGIKPTWASPEYGYIECEPENQSSKETFLIRKVRAFREKPNPTLAQEFLEKGNFVWNAGMFLWSIPFFFAELAKHCPDLEKFARKVASSSNFDKNLKEEFCQLKARSIDYALMEKSQNILNIKANFSWNDVGSWQAIEPYLSDYASNKSNQKIISLNADKNLFFADKKTAISLLGVDNLIVIQTEDALLIASRKEIHRIKDLLKEIPEDLL